MNNLSDFANPDEIREAKKSYATNMAFYHNAFENLPYEAQLEEIILVYRKINEDLSRVALEITEYVNEAKE